MEETAYTVIVGGGQHTRTFANLRDAIDDIRRVTTEFEGTLEEQLDFIRVQMADWSTSFLRVVIGVRRIRGTMHVPVYLEVRRGIASDMDAPAANS